MRQIVAAAAVGLILRLVVSWAAVDAPAMADMEQYHGRALHLFHHREFGPDALRGPGYPLLLAAAYATLGESLWSARVANGLAGGLLVLLTGLLARAMGLGARAWVASALVAIYPGFVLSSVYLMPDSFFAVWVVACLLALRRRSYGFAVLAGALAGGAMLTRSVGLILLPTAAVVWAYELGRRKASVPQVAARAGLFVFAGAVVLAPWLSYTTRIAGRPLLDSTSGLNMLIGSNPRATGRLEMRDGQWLTETYVSGAVNVADADSRAARAAAQWAVENPTRWAQLAAVKVASLWGLEGREHSALYSRDYFGPRRDATVLAWGVAILASFPLLVVAALAGAVGVNSGWTALRLAVATLVAVTTVLHVVSFGESRFHLPLVPLLAVLAAARWPTWRHVPWPRAVAAGTAVVFLAWAWTTQLPELSQRLDTLRQPNGSMSVIEY